MWKVLGASVVGVSHERAGQACEDACRWLAARSLTCLVVADGAGSRPQAGRGATVAVTRVTQLAVEANRSGVGSPDTWVRSAMSDVRECLLAIAAGEAIRVDDLGTTLAVALLTPDALCVGQIGDTIAVVRRAGAYETVDPAPRFEYANETAFVTDPDAGAHLRLRVMAVDDVEEVFLSTDGLRLKILDDLASARPYTPFFADVGSYARTPEATSQAISDLLTRLADQTGDDKTLLVAVRDGGLTTFSSSADGSWAS